MNHTRRQAIASALREEALSGLDIARRFRVPVKTAIDDLAHIARSLRGGEKLVVRESECLSCGYRFAGRRRLSTPSRCPCCRSEQIAEPLFSIE